MMNFKNYFQPVFFLLLCFTASCRFASANQEISAPVPIVLAEHDDVKKEPVSFEAQRLTEERLKNMTYQGIYPEPITLENGLFEGEPFMEGGASRPIVVMNPLSVIGDINSDGVMDAAVFLAENSGGSGTFVYLAAILDQDGDPENVSTFLLGDRVAPESISIVDGGIVLVARTHAAEDPICCPSLTTRITFELQDGKLVQIASEELAS